MAVMSEISTPLNKELLQICFCTHGGDLLISVARLYGEFHKKLELINTFRHYS